MSNTKDYTLLDEFQKEMYKEYPFFADLIEQFKKEREQPQPNVLLTTEDGVEITDGEQQVYWFDGDMDYVYRCSAIHAKVVKAKLFSTEQLAKDYIENNRKQFSIEDLESVWDWLCWTKEEKQKFISALTNQTVLLSAGK